MKRHFSGTILSLLLLLNLTACGGIPSDGAYSFVPEASNDVVTAVVPPVDLPVLSPEDGSQENGSQSVPDENQAPSNAGSGSSGTVGNQPADKGEDQGNKAVDENGWYTSKEEVAMYIHLYEHLPDNYVTKREAEDAGWGGGNVERYTGEGTAIGGSPFGNREGLLPKEQGRTYTECDIDTVGKNSRGAKRIVFSNDGLVYYTDDHYESFELLYGEP